MSTHLSSVPFISFSWSDGRLRFSPIVGIHNFSFLQYTLDCATVAQRRVLHIAAGPLGIQTWAFCALTNKLTQNLTLKSNKLLSALFASASGLTLRHFERRDCLKTLFKIKTLQTVTATSPAAAQWPIGVQHQHTHPPPLSENLFWEIFEEAAMKTSLTVSAGWRLHGSAS